MKKHLKDKRDFKLPLRREVIRQFGDRELRAPYGGFHSTENKDQGCVPSVYTCQAE